MQKCRFFQIFELVPESLHKRFDEDRLWRIFDNRMLLTIDRVRIRYNRKAYINDWYWRGIYEHRGFRRFGCPIGAKLSDHKFGRAFDMTFEGLSSEEIRVDIRGNPNIKAFEYITIVENNVSWLHISCGNWDKKKYGILFFF